MSSVSDATTRLQESFERERAQNREAHERDSREKSNDYEEQLRSKSQEYNRRLQEIRAEAQEDVRRLKDEVYDKNGRTKTRDAVELQEERRRLGDYRDELRRETESRIQKVEQAAEIRAQKSGRNEESRVGQALEDQKRSHLQEITALHDELTHYRHLERDIDSERQQVRQKEIDEYEGQHLQEKDRIISNYERQIEKLHSRQDERDEHFTRRMIETQMDGDRRSEKQLRDQKHEFTQVEKDRRRQLQQLEEHFDQQIRIEKGRNDRSTDTLITQSTQDKERAIEAKDQTYREYLKQNKAQHDLERQKQESELQTLKTTSDATKVSPYVAEKIRRGAEERYHQQLEVANRVNTDKLQAARLRDQQERSDLQEQYSLSLQEKTKNMQTGQDLEKRQFMTAYDDLQHSKIEERRDLENRHRGSVERLLSQKTTDETLSERRHQDQLSEQRVNFREEKLKTTAELETKNRDLERDWSARYRDMKRGMERQIAEAREQHETKMAEMRYEYDKKLRDTERLSHRALEDRVRAYEHQMKQQELAFKEKERFLTERYEEELDRMRHTNARLIQKKS
jgi:hypothetical protein